MKSISDRQKNTTFVAKQYTQKDIRVRDHCYITGKYRGSAHQGFNLNYFRLEFEEMKTTVLFHKLPGYDSHFIMQEISQIANKYTNKNMKGEDRQVNIIGGRPWIPKRIAWQPWWLPINRRKNPRFSKYAFQLLWKNKTEIQYKHLPS